MNVLAMIGYAAYPLMPPRLLNDCAMAFGGCVPGFHFVDTMDVYGGLWSWRSSTVEKVSNVDGEYCHSNAVSFNLCGLVIHALEERWMFVVECSTDGHC